MPTHDATADDDPLDDPLDDPRAELADLLLNVARLVRALTPSGPGIVAMTDTERTVMRVVDLHPGCAPSEIARRARVQRTNVSTALHALERKGMVRREQGAGRHVTVAPTDLAVTNLRLLRVAWSRALAGSVEDPAALRGCNEFLASLERRLTHDADSGREAGS